MKRVLFLALAAMFLGALTSTAQAGDWHQLTWRKTDTSDAATTDSIVVYIDHNTVDTTEVFRLDAASGRGGGMFQDNDDVTTERSARQIVIYWEATATVDSISYAVDYFFRDKNDVQITGDVAASFTSAAATTDEAYVVDLSPTTDWTHARVRVKEGDLSHTTSIENVRVFVVTPTWMAN